MFREIYKILSVSKYNKIEKYWHELIVYLDLVTITTVFTWIKLYTINTFWHTHPKQMFSISRSVYYFTFRMFPDFWTSDLVFRRMVVQLLRMAFLNKIYSPRRVDFGAPISKSSLGTPPPPFLFHFLGLHILNYKYTNFYQNLSEGSTWVEWP